MANKKYKLTDGNYWATDGIHDFGQNKTQREINAALVQADSDLSGALTSVEKGLAIIVTGDTCTTAVPSGGYAYIKNNTHGLTEGLYRNKSASAFPTSGGTANSTIFESATTGIANQVTPISLGGTGANNGAEGLRKLGLATGVVAGTSVSGRGTYYTAVTGDQIFFLFGKFGTNPLMFILLTNSGTATITSLIANTASNLIPTVSVENGKTRIDVPSWESLRYFSYYGSGYFE